MMRESPHPSCRDISSCSSCWRRWPCRYASQGATDHRQRARRLALVAWTPIPENPVFAGTGQRHLGPQDPRARLHPGRRRRHLSSLVHRLRRRPPADHVAGPCDVARRHSLGPRPGKPDLRRVVGRRHVRRPRDGTYFMFAEGKNDIAHLLTSTDGRKWTDLGSLDIRKTDGTPISPGPYGTPTAWFENGTWYLFYERGDQGVWLATSKDLKVWTNVQGRPGHRHGPRALRQDCRGRQPGRQARRLLLRVLPRQLPSDPGKTGRPAWPARATWSTGRSIPATPSSRTTARARSWSTRRRAGPALHHAP